MDKINIKPFHENRVNDITFAQVYLDIANRHGNCLNETKALIDELHEYINYLYSHIEQLEKDKKYLAKQYLIEKYKNKEPVK